MLPDTMKVVPEQLAEFNKLKKIVIPDSVQKIGEGAFQFNELETIQFGKGLTEIGAGAFVRNDNLKAVTIPATVKKIGANAFEMAADTGSLTGSIVIQGSSSGISDQAFGESYTLSFSKGAKEAKASLYNPTTAFYKKKIKVTLEWSRVKGVSGYELVTATNAKFTKNKKKLTVKAGAKKKTVTMKGKFKIGKTKVYARIRPYTKVKGKKVYGRWSGIAG
ncbi:MAG: leucine-rich repeat domain-containing protein [Roseburia sp.]|nr:leucine-rich repeat domain-containing protein [Roseburia sp.]